MQQHEPIFDLTNSNYEYIGVFLADMDLKIMEKEVGIPPPPGFHGGFMAVIFRDENKVLKMTGRIKFSSGSKQIYRKEYGKFCYIDDVISDFNKLNLVNGQFHYNHGKDGSGIMDVLEKLDMIESIQIIKKEDL